MTNNDRDFFDQAMLVYCSAMLQHKDTALNTKAFGITHNATQFAEQALEMRNKAVQNIDALKGESYG